MDKYAKQHTVDAYRFELGNVGDPQVVQSYIDNTLNNIDNCLARRVAWGIGASMPDIGSGPSMVSANSAPTYASLYPLNPGQEANKSNEGLQVAIVASDAMTSTADVSAIMAVLEPQKVSLTIVAPRIGTLKTGVNATASFITTSDVFYDAVFVGSCAASNGTCEAGLSMDASGFIMQAYGHGKAVGLLGSNGGTVAKALRIMNEPGVYVGAASAVTMDVLHALAGPVRFPQRFPTDDVAAICEG